MPEGKNGEKGNKGMIKEIFAYLWTYLFRFRRNDKKYTSSYSLVKSENSKLKDTFCILPYAQNKLLKGEKN